MKEKIALHARRLFDKHGFHGTSLRDLCKLAGCQMPTVYYYYENKEVLYDKIVGEAFITLVARLWSELPEDVSLREHAVLMVLQKKHLSEDERLIYRLAMKTWLGFEDCGRCRQRLMEWEQTAYENSWMKYDGLVASKQWAKFISRTLTSVIQRIILLDEDIADTEILEEIGMIFEVAAHTKNKQKEE